MSAHQESDLGKEEEGIASPYPYLNPESREWGDERDEESEDDGDDDGDDGGGVLARCSN
jgi:hypothetical protein